MNDKLFQQLHKFICIICAYFIQNCNGSMNDQNMRGKKNINMMMNIKKNI